MMLPARGWLAEPNQTVDDVVNKWRGPVSPVA